MRGRKPKPTTLKIADGVRAARINFIEPVLPAAKDDAPDWLRGDALKHWRELAPLLIDSGVLTVGDKPALAQLCVAFAEWRSSGDFRAHELYRKLLAEFGLTPSSRSRIKAAPKAPKDDLAEFC